MGEADGGICSGKMVGGRYRLLSMLGRGGMAQVWRGHDERLDREVAVKILNSRGEPDGCERFEREARTAAALSHANIVGLHDAGSDHDVDYLVMELVEGETLGQRIRRGPLPVSEIADLAAQMCDALAAAHAAGIVHRDIKPGNVLITETGQVKVCDFGIACHDNETVEAGGEDAGNDMAVGTAQYMAPEQARGGPAAPRTDLYGLGCVLYAMVTGQPPFSSKTSARVAWQHLNEVPVPLASRRPGTPSWLDGLVMSLLAKDPAERPYSAVEVRGLLPERKTLRHREPKPAAKRAHRPARATSLSETTVHLAPPRAPLLAGRVRLATSGVLGFIGSAAIVLILSAITGNDMPRPKLNAPAVTQTTNGPALAQDRVQAQPVSNPANALNALRAAIDDQEHSGNIEGKPLRDLDRKLDEIQHDLARGETGAAAGKLEDVAKTLAELRHEDRIDAPTLYALQSALGDLAEQLPQGAGDD